MYACQLADGAYAARKVPGNGYGVSECVFLNNTVILIGPIIWHYLTFIDYFENCL